MHLILCLIATSLSAIREKSSIIHFLTTGVPSSHEDNENAASMAVRESSLPACSLSGRLEQQKLAFITSYTCPCNGKVKEKKKDREKSTGKKGRPVTIWAR
jgi:hypothetical protein